MQRQIGALGALVSWKVPLPMAGGLELNGPSGAFQPKQFYDYLAAIAQVMCFTRGRANKLETNMEGRHRKEFSYEKAHHDLFIN